MQNYNFVRGFVWVWNLVSDIKGATQKSLHKYCESTKNWKGQQFIHTFQKQFWKKIYAF
jgi:hypothetical protein